jgi:hypothetical protein
MPACPTVDESLDCLHRAGWPVGDYGTATRWVVSGGNGENPLYAEGQTRAEAWWRAVRRVVWYGIPSKKEAVEPKYAWVNRLTESRKADRDQSRSVKPGAGRSVEPLPGKTLVARSTLHCVKPNPGWSQPDPPSH